MGQPPRADGLSEPHLGRRPDVVTVCDAGVRAYFECLRRSKLSHSEAVTETSRRFQCRKANSSLEGVSVGLAVPGVPHATVINVVGRFRREQCLAALVTFDYWE